MNGEIITIGNELTSGRILDLNSQYAAKRLTSSGLRVTSITSVGDDYKKISETLKKAVKISRFVIVTGGLGSTEDDLTIKIVAEALNRPLFLNKQVLERIRRFAESRGTRISPSLEKMAWLPKGSRIISSERAVCGFSLAEKDVHLYFLPGVPEEMRYLMDRFVLPELLSLYKTVPVMKQRALKVYGLNESGIAEIIKKLHDKTGDIIIGFYPNFPENHISMSLKGNDELTVTKELDRVEKEIRHCVGPSIFTSGNQNMEDVVGQMLLGKNLTISVAESCTGGLIGHRLTNVPGSSKYFQGGVVAYSNQSKINFLQVHPGTLKRYGAVSDNTVREMARGVREYVKTDLGLAVTGIAGPDGGTKEKPIGTVYIGLAAPDDIFSGKYRFYGNRKHIKSNISIMALDWVRRYLNGDPFLSGI